MRSPQSELAQELLTSWPPLSEEFETEFETSLFLDKRAVNRMELPRELRRLHQWVVWRLGSHQSTVEYFNPRNGAPASVTEPETWGSCRQAQNALSRGYDGIVLAYPCNQPYIGVDLADCMRRCGINEQARVIIEPDMPRNDEPSAPSFAELARRSNVSARIGQSPKRYERMKTWDSSPSKKKDAARELDC
jgi:hypothetical protein